MTATPSPIRSPRPLGVIRCAASAALSVTVLFALCWVGAVAVESQSHMFIALFTTQPVASTAALVEGLCWSLVFGALAGALIAAFYNLLPFRSALIANDIGRATLGPSPGERSEMTKYDWKRPALIAAGSAALILMFYLLREHRGHAVGYLPYLILAVCPFLHLLHGGHGRGGDS